jgi:hypothetical protein
LGKNTPPNRAMRYFLGQYSSWPSQQRPTGSPSPLSTCYQRPLFITPWKHLRMPQLPLFPHSVFMSLFF